MKFLLFEVSLYVSEATIHPCIPYHNVVSLYWIIVYALAGSLGQLAHCRIMTTPTLFIGIFVEGVNLNLINHFLFPNLAGNQLFTWIDFMIVFFLSLLLDVIRMFVTTYCFLIHLNFAFFNWRILSIIRTLHLRTVFNKPLCMLYLLDVFFLV